MTRIPFQHIAASAALFLSLGASQAAPVNLISNGSFESGLAGWTLGGSPVVSTPTANPIVAITYGAAAAYPVGAFGEAVPVPTDATLSPDAAGTRGAYFVDDAAINQSLVQTVFLLAGSYRIGFDIYAPNNGYGNPIDASFSAQIAGVTLTNTLVSNLLPATWINVSSLATIASSGFYSTAFVFNTPGQGQAKDVVIDRVFVLASDETGGQVIPEPETLALFGIALAGLAVVRRRKAA